MKKKYNADNAEYVKYQQLSLLPLLDCSTRRKPWVIVDSVSCGVQTCAYGVIRFCDYTFKNFCCTKALMSDCWKFESYCDLLPEHKALIISKVKKFMVKRGLL